MVDAANLSWNNIAPLWLLMMNLKNVSSTFWQDSAANDEDEATQELKNRLTFLLALTYSVIISAVLICMTRWLPTVLVWTIIGSLHGLLLLGKLVALCHLCSGVTHDAPNRQIAGHFNQFLFVLLFMPYTHCAAAIIGFVEFGTSLNECKSKRIAGLIIGTGSSVFLIVSLTILLLSRKRLIVETNKRCFYRRQPVKVRFAPC